MIWRYRKLGIECSNSSTDKQVCSHCVKTVIITILTLILSISVYGNDGAYLTRGGVIYPTLESKISLDREILSFSVQDNVCRVDILFEFNNPDNIDKKLLVGFQAPIATGDISEEIHNTNQIADFKIISNGQVLPYKLKAAECENCELKEPKDIHFSEFKPGIFVYLFELTFKPGLNKVNHSYMFPASSNVVLDQIYNYILTTGSKWAGGRIKNLTVSFDLGYNKYFYVNDVFGKNANWSIIGRGKITNEKMNNYGITNDAAKMVRIISGRLQIDIADFQPKSNIEFGIINNNSFSAALTDKRPDKLFLALKDLTLDLKIFEGKELTKEELKLLRNTIYAQYGYTFNSKDLQDYFTKFEWYLPDPNLTMEQIKLTEKEKKFIDEILKREKE